MKIIRQIVLPASACRKYYGYLILCGGGKFIYFPHKGHFKVPFRLNLGEITRTGMSGCQDYSLAHITMSGWIEPKPFLPVKGNERLISQYGISPIDPPKIGRSFIYDLLISLSKEKYKLFFDEGEIDVFLEKLTQEYDIIESLVDFFRRGKIYTKVYGGIEIEVEEVKFSFTSKVRIKKGGLEKTLILPKKIKIFETTTFLYRKVVVENDSAELIVLQEFLDQEKFVCYYRSRQNEYWRGMEKYKNHTHPECTIDFYGDQLPYYFLDSRLGDLLFESYNIGLSLICDNISEIKKIPGGEKLVVEEKDGNVYITHPEHGTLRVNKWSKVFRVPYIRKGHD